jgi:hypothetical protein
MSDEISDIDSEGVYSGMSLAEFGVRVSGRGVGSMPREQLRKSIQHLQDELADGEPLSKDDRAQLETVLGEVSGILDSDDAPPGRSFDELPTLAERFESSHPNLAVVLGRIADSLSQLGI